jgi:hypothetical protein
LEGILTDASFGLAWALQGVIFGASAFDRKCEIPPTKQRKANAGEPGKGASGEGFAGFSQLKKPSACVFVPNNSGQTAFLMGAAGVCLA